MGMELITFGPQWCTSLPLQVAADDGKSTRNESQVLHPEVQGDKTVATFALASKQFSVVSVHWLHLF